MQQIDFDARMKVSTTWLLFKLAQTGNRIINMTAEPTIKDEVLVTHAGIHPAVAAVEPAGLLPIQILAVGGPQSIRSLTACVRAKTSFRWIDFAMQAKRNAII